MKNRSAFPGRSSLDEGMTLREYFACEVMKTLLVTQKSHNFNFDLEDPDVRLAINRIGETSFAIADVMLKKSESDRIALEKLKRQ